MVARLKLTFIIFPRTRRHVSAIKALFYSFYGKEKPVFYVRISNVLRKRAISSKARRKLSVVARR